MKILKLNDTNFSGIIKECVNSLKKPGAVLLVPTETVYGLVCRISDKIAVNRIYELKKRSENKPLALFVRRTSMLEPITGPMPREAEILASEFCPGPITIIVPDKSGAKTGFRIPDHPFILGLLEELSEPLASTSANRSGNPAALNTADALADFDGAPDIAVDGGQIPENSIASTVVDVAAGSFKILRSGPITEEMISKALGEK